MARGADYPLIPGITETSQMGDDEPMLELVEEMRGRLPRPTRDRLVSVMGELETVFKLESDEPTRARIGAAISMLRGTGRSKQSNSDSSEGTRSGY